MIAKNVIDLIGKTPMLELSEIAEKDSARVLAKLELFNPGGSIKDRISMAMISDAEEKGLISNGSVIIEPTSGNTGIGLALISAVKGYRCIIVMPETMSKERQGILKVYGAEIVLTPGMDGMEGAIAKAEELLGSTPKSFMPQQFINSANPKIHRKTTAREILEEVDALSIDAFIAGVGTGGSLTGVGEGLKEKNPNIKIIAVEPESSAVLSGGKGGPHKIQGIGAGFIPEVLNRSIIDEVITVGDNESFCMSKILAKKYGLFVGISSGAAACAAVKVAEITNKSKSIVTLFPDGGERYLSMEKYF